MCQEVNLNDGSKAVPWGNRFPDTEKEAKRELRREQGSFMFHGVQHYPNQQGSK